MTREELIAKVEEIIDTNQHDLKQYTIGMLHCFHNRLLIKYECSEKYPMEAFLSEFTHILEIMRPDLLDHDVLSRIKFLIEKRLKAIENEQS